MRWNRFFERARRDRDFDDELASYLAHEIEDNIALGMNPQQAREAALRKLGNRTALQEEIHRMNSPGLIETIWQDLRYGARNLIKNPAFATVAILSLALGIGANTALFQLIDAIMLRSLPVEAPEQLMRIGLPPHSSRSGDVWGAPNDITNPQWEFLKAHHAPFQDVFTWGNAMLNLSEGGTIRFAHAIYVSGDFFRTLGVPALIGRTLAGGDDHRGCGAPAAVLNYSFWQREFGGTQSILNRTVSLEGHRFPIVGVTPPQFSGIDVGHQFDVAIPLCSIETISQKNDLDNREFWFLGAFGRLKPGASTEQADAFLKSISPSLYRSTLSPHYLPDTARDYLRLKLGATPGASGFSNERIQARTPLLLLFCLAGLVLLIACANLANLMLAHSAVRGHEIAVRLAIGASRRRIVQQLLTESLLLAALSTVTGSFLAHLLGTYLVASLGTSRNAYFLPLRFDTHVLAFLAGVTIFTCLVFGLIPALRASRAQVNTVMKQGSRSVTSSRERFGLQQSLVASQIAFSLVLAVGSLLFVRSFQNLITLNPGFRANGILVARLVFPPDLIPQQRRMAAYAAILQNLRAIPGVDSAAAVNNPPLMGGYGNGPIRIDGIKPDKYDSVFNYVSEGYFATMRIPLLAGRDFTLSDNTSSTLVALVDDTFAARFLGGANPIGRTLYLLPKPSEQIVRYRIVGIVGKSKYSDLSRDFDPIVYFSIRQQQSFWNGMNFEVHSTLPLATTMKAIEFAILRVNSQFNIDLRSFPAQIHESVRHEDMLAKLSSFFGVLAIILATVGLYGVMSYIATHRRNEIGIRLAIGATRNSILFLVLKQSLLVLTAGLAIGAAFSIAFAHWAQSLLFELHDSGPFLIVLAALALGAITIAAALIPARRASLLDPMQTLRNE